MKLSEYLKKFRTEHDLSQRQLALMCGVSNGYISMLERNENPKTGEPIAPTIPQLEKLSVGMHVSLEAMLNAIDEIPICLSDVQDGPVYQRKAEDEVEDEILYLLRKLDDRQRKEILDYVRFKASQTQ